MNLIIGASGTVGSRVGRLLLDRGEAVRAVSRDPARLAGLTSLGAVPIQGDLRKDEWMAAALQGARSLVLASHGLVPPTRNNHPGITDATGNRRIIDAARQAGVERVVFVSATSGADSRLLFGQVKYRTEEYLKASGVPHTIVRPTVFMETHALRLLGDPLRRTGSVQFFGSGTTRLNWISADDVAEYIVHALATPALRGRTVSIGGPDNLSRIEALAVIEDVLARSARRRHVPVGVMRAMRLLIGPVHPGMRYLLDIALAECTTPDDPTWAPSALDWTGPTTLVQVVRRWASGTPGSH